MAAKLMQRFRQLPRALLAFSEAVSDDAQFGKGIIMRFVDALMHVHPTLRLAILLSTPWVSLGFALARYRLVMKGFATVQQYLVSCITGSVLVPTAHPLYQPVMAYMVKQGLGQRARKLALQLPQAKSQLRSHDMFPFDMGLGRGNKPIKQQEQDQKPDMLELVPDVGKFTFVYNGQRLCFKKRAASHDKASPDYSTVMPARGESEETIVLSCMNLLGNTKPITDFLRHIKESTEMATESMTKIFRPENLSGQITWDQGVARPARTLDAVTLDAHVKDPLVADVQNYLSDDTKKFYISRNIPWRRGYLFYGPPGTGKTSMACAMAGQYGLNVYLLSMTQTGINDETLVNLFEALPSRCILLLEDIDSAGIKREDMKKPVKKAISKRRRHQPYHYDVPMLYDEVGNLLDPDNKNKLTLSTLLNVLDGISAPEGRIVIMTSNNPDSLDKALVRPGRIDRKVLFDYASNEVAYNLFLRIFGDSGRDNVTPMARAFADQIPENMITPAEVQGHLLQNMASAVEALENTSKFVEDLVAEKRSGTNVAGFKAEVADSGAQESVQQRTQKASSAVNIKTAGSFDVPGDTLEHFSGLSESPGSQGLPAAVSQQVATTSLSGSGDSAVPLAIAAPPTNKPRKKKRRNQNGGDLKVLTTPLMAGSFVPSDLPPPIPPPPMPVDIKSINAFPSTFIPPIPAADQPSATLTAQVNLDQFIAALSTINPPMVNFASTGVEPDAGIHSDEISGTDELHSIASTPISSEDGGVSSNEHSEEEEMSESEVDDEDGDEGNKMADSAYEST